MFNCKYAYVAAGNLALKDKQINIKMHAAGLAQPGILLIERRNGAAEVAQQLPEPSLSRQAG